MAVKRASSLSSYVVATLVAAALPFGPALAQSPDVQAPAPEPDIGEAQTAPTPPQGSEAPPQSSGTPDASEREVPALPVPPTAGGSTARVPSTEPRASKATRNGPDSVADLADKLLDAVVNVSTSQGVDRPGRGVPPLEAPEGSPLQDFFNDLLRDRDGPGERSVQSLGSGFVIDPSGLIVTNNHVIGDADTITVNFPNGDQLDAELIGKDAKTDLALLKVEAGKPLPYVDFGNSEDLRIGDWVMAIGNPFGLGGSVSIDQISPKNA